MAGQEKAQVHVLMVTISLQGHMNPMLRLANSLISKGLHVTIATNEVGRRRMLNFTAAAAATQINFQFFSDRAPHLLTFESIQKEGSKNLSSLIKNLTADGTTSFSCVIVNPFVPYAVEVAAEHGLPCAIFWIQAFSVFSIYYHFFKSPHLFPSLEDPHEAVVLPGMPAMVAGDLPSFIQPGSPPYYKKILGDLVEKLDKVRWVLGNSFRELEEEVVESMAPVCPIRPVGPVVSPFLLGEEEGVAGNVDLWSAEESCMEWLEKQAPSSVIYISFGSISVLSQHKMDSIAKALTNCKKPFLWVVRPPDKELGHDESGELSAEFLEETKDKGLVVTWCPQEKVLMHKAVGCFMTHCGWNSCLEAVVTGVPVITSPEWSDQLPNAKLLVDVLKIGVRVRLTCGGAEEVERCFREVTDDGATAGEFKKKVMEWKKAARKAVQDGGSSDLNLDQFINEITA